MQSMRLEYIILSCERQRQGERKRKIGRDRERSVKEGKRKQVKRVMEMERLWKGF